MSTLPSQVKVNGKIVKISPDKGKPAGTKTTCTYGEKWLYINFTWDGKPLTIEIVDSKRM
jgi:hypothetical protein